MKNRMRSLALCLTVLCVVLPLLVCASDTTVSLDTVLAETAAVLEKTPPSVGSVGGEWAVIGLARSDKGTSAWFDTYRKAVRQHVRGCDGVLHKRKYTEYARVSLALTVIGEDPTDFAGFDLVYPLTDTKKVLNQGTSSAVWALIALDGVEKGFPNALSSSDYAAAREAYLSKILSAVGKDGGFALSSTAGSDVDLTAMALVALAPYAEKSAVQTAIDSGFAYLSRVQNADGGFSTAGTPTAESCAQVLTALCTYGISVNDERFVKNGCTVLDALLAYRTDNGFRHTADASDANAMATEQAFYALAALKRMRDGKAALFELSDVMQNRAATQGAGIGGTGLEGKHPAVRVNPIRFAGKTFADIAEHPSKAHIEALAARGIVSGKSDVQFDPNGAVTRAEFCAMTVRALGLETIQAENRFADVEANSWYAPYVSTAFSYGLVNGLSDTQFDPNGSITREQATVMISRAAALCGMETELTEEALRMSMAPFSDAASIADWAKNEVAFCLAYGILSSESADFAPKEFETRAELADMLFGLLNAADLL